MPLFNDTITLGVKADMTPFERDVLASYSKMSTRLKPLDIRLKDGVSQPLGKITGDISQFNKSLDAASARVLAFSASVGIINGVQNAFRSLVRETIEVEKALTDINTVLNTSQKGLDQFGNSLFDIARSTASSFKEVTSAAVEFSRQGLSIQQTLKATNAALLLARISGLDAADSVKALTTAINGFNKEALDYEQIVNRLASVDANFAVSTKDIAEALSRVGSTADEAGVSFNELIATVTAVQQTTSRGGAVIGNALKSIFTRISRDTTISQLRELGVAIDESQTGIERLRAIAQAVERVDRTTANTIKELAGGVFQINVVTAALGDLTKEYTVYDNALRIANQSTDEAVRRNEQLNQTLAALASQAGTNIQELLSKLGKISFSGNLKGLFGEFNGFTKGLIDAIDGDSIGSQIGQGVIQGIGNFILGPGGVVLLGFFGKIFLQVAKDATSAFKSIYGITSESEKQAQLQSTIAQRLAANAALYERQLLTGKGIAGVQQEILAGLAREAEMRAAIARVAASAASELSPLVAIKKGQIIPKAAGGFIPAMVREQRDIMAGVGGATPGSKPVLISRFNFGNTSGPVVANTSEKIVDNWLGGKGSAILNQEMIDALGGDQALSKFGKVRNVADGYVPNLASYAVAGGKVNLKKRGGDLILDEILAPFNPATGERVSGTGIVRQAFDLAIEEGKKIGAENLVVDIINSKVASSLNNNPRFSPFGPFSIGKFKFPLMAFAGGFVPSLANNPLANAVNREVDALVQQGVSQSAAKSSIRVGSSPVLSGPQNPFGLGVYNTAQGQTSLTRAFADHGGQNLKYVGKADGFVPSLAKFQGFGIGDLKNPGNKNVAVAVLDEVNQLLESITNSLDPKARSADIAKVTALYARLGDKSVELVGKQLDQAVEYSAKRILAPTLSGRGLTKAGGGQLGKDVIQNINDQIRKASTTTSEVEFRSISADLAKLEKDVSKGSFERIKQALIRAGKFSEGDRATTTSAATDIFTEAQGKIAKRGLFSTTTVNDILKGSQGFDALPPQEQALLKQRLAQDARANRRESFGRASLGIAFAGSLATPFLDQGAASLRANGNNGAAGAVSTASGALTGASFGAIFGPWGLAIGGLAGGIVSLGKAMDGSANKAEELTKRLDTVGSTIAQNLNGFSSYIQTQQKLNGIIEEGGKATDIAQVREELSRVFSAISDPELRQKIIATGGDVKKLGEAFAEAQAKGFATKSTQEAITFAAQEKAANTNFLGVRTQSTFSAGAVNDISRVLLAGAPQKSLKEFGDAIKNLDGTVSQNQFVDVLGKIGVKTSDATSLFEDLEQPLNRLLLLRGLRQNLDFAKQLEEATNASVKYKKSIVDLNKTIGTLTTITDSQLRTLAGFRANAFSLQQNGAQQAAGLRFFNAGQFAQAQLSTAFQSNQVRFSAGQDRETARLDLVRTVAGALEQNREKLSTDPKLAKALDEFVVSAGQVGDIGQIAAELLRKGVGSGEDLQAFSNLATTFEDAKNRLASIDDNEKTQLGILRQNLDALKQRIQIENKANLLGGAEGQIGFARAGFDRIANRGANARLSGLGGEVGAFGRNEQALGILEFQKAFGGVDGLDARKFIPNAEQVVADSIKQSLIEGFGRLNLPINKETLDQFGSVAQISAAKQFERKELTAVEIGQAVGASFKYDTMAAGSEKAFNSALVTSGMVQYSSAVPEIKAFLQARFGLERDRAELGQKAAQTEGDLQRKQQDIVNIRADINKLKQDSIASLRSPSRNVTLFGNAALQAADAADLKAAKSNIFAGQDIQNLGPSDLATLNQRASSQISRLIPSNGNLDEFKKNINEAVNGGGLFGGNEFLKNALLTQFDGGFDKNARGQREITNEAFNKIIDALERAGAVQRDPAALAQIEQKNTQIADIQKQAEPLKAQLDSLTASLANLQKQIDAEKAAGPKAPGAVARATGSGGSAAILPNLPNVDLSPGFFARFIASQKPAAASAESVAKANQENAARRQTALTFGELDTSTIQRLATARQNLADVGGRNEGIERSIRDLETALLRQAQSQQLTLGRADPRLQSVVGAGNFRQNSQRISTNVAQATFQDLVKQANEAFVSGFVTQSDLTKIGIRINQGLEDYVRAQIKLGYSEAEARAMGKKIRNDLQKELDQLDIKLPKNKIEEFGQGFKARTEELQKSFDDLGGLGASTADSLVNGFGDAFFDIASGAQSAEDAVRGMLSSIAADLSKFFAKRAFASIFSSFAGNASAGSFGGFAQGGITKGVPALVMGGEHAFSPEVVRAYGVDFFKDLNAGKVSTKALGGRITGGSGYRDDVYGHFPEGTFILQKSAVNKYGPDFLNSVEQGAKYAKGGQVQKAFFGAILGQIIGGAIQGAVVGGATAAITGGDWKKGALLGGIGGGIAGGVGGYSYAKSNPNAGFGGGFQNSFAWTKGLFGSKESSSGLSQFNANGAPGSGINGGAGSLPSADSLTFNSKLPDLDVSTLAKTNQSIVALNGGNATGLGNQSLTFGQVASKPSIWKSAGTNLAVGASLALLASAAAPKSSASTGSSTIKGTGSVTTYNSDGSVTINGAGGYQRTIKRTDYNSTSQLEQLVSQNGGQLPEGGLPKFASGGQVSSGSGSVAYRDRAILGQINKTFAQAFALGGMLKPKQPVGLLAMGGDVASAPTQDMFARPISPIISMGSGTKDDVPILGKKGEYMVNDRATDFWGKGFMDRLNAMQLSPQDAQRVGVLTMASGGPVEYDPSNRDRGLFTLAAPSGQAPAAPRGGGGNGDTNIEITINMSPNGQGATVETKNAGQPSGQEDRNSVDSQKFAAKFKTMFLELVEQEKRPGGSLYKDNING
jgi:TP901 family phage tail tape measure protein